MRVVRLCCTVVCLSVSLPSWSAVLRVKADAPGPPHDGLTWQTAFTTVSPAIAAASSGDEVWIAQGTYSENLTVKPGVSLFGGFVGSETTRDQRDATTNITSLTAASGSIVTVPTETGTDTVFDGFTLSGGHGTLISADTYYGGAIYCLGSATISHNVIKNNHIVGGFYWCGFHLCSTGGGYGGGLYISGGSPIIRGNAFTGNSAWWGGGALCCTGGAPVIESNTMTGNSVEGKSGGALCCSGSGALIHDNTIQDNTVRTTDGNVDPYTRGGGIYIVGGSCVVSGNRISRNNGWTGGGIYAAGAQTQIRDNIIRGNFAEEGSGVYVRDGQMSGNAISGNENSLLPGLLNGRLGGAAVNAVGDVFVAYNTVTSNRGAGVYADSAGAVVVSNVLVANTGPGIAGGTGARAVNNTIVHNGDFGVWLEGPGTVANNIVAFNGSGIAVGSGTSGDPVAGVSHNCVYGNTLGWEPYPQGASAYGQALPDLTGQNGNISVDPGLANIAFGNLHIQPVSPCVDAGDSSAVPADVTDMDGQPRTQGGQVDIGADESDGTAWPSGPPRIVRVKPDGDDAADGSSWAGARKSVQSSVALLGPSGGEVWVAAGTYNEQVSMGSYTGLYGGFAGTETSRDQRTASAGPTVINAPLGQSGIAVAVGSAECGVDGVTVQNGEIGIGSDLCTSLSVSNSRILNSGGGVVTHGNLHLDHCEVSHCTTTYDRGGVVNASNATVTDCTLADNTGPYALLAAALGVLSRCRITGTTGSYGIGATVDVDGFAYVADCVFSHNGLYGLETDCPTVIENSTFVEPNTGFSWGYDYNNQNAALLAINCIFAFCQTGVDLYGGSTSGPPSTFRNCLFYGNKTADVTRELNAAYPVYVAEVSSDPRFVNAAAGDYHLQAGSPAIDAGDDTGFVTGDRDLDGNPRKIGAHVDIGAYEFITPGAYMLADAIHALRFAAGLSTAGPDDVARLHLATGASGPGIGLPDVVRIARKMAGLAPNP